MSTGGGGSKGAGAVWALVSRCREQGGRGGESRTCWPRGVPPAALPAPSFPVTPPSVFPQPPDPARVGTGSQPHLTPTATAPHRRARATWGPADAGLLPRVPCQPAPGRLPWVPAPSWVPGLQDTCRQRRVLCSPEVRAHADAGSDRVGTDGRTQAGSHRGPGTSRGGPGWVTDGR